VNGVIIGTTTFGITAIITLAISVWNGDTFDKALHSAITSGLKVGGVSFATAILSGQITKAGGYGLVANASEEIVRAIGPKASAVLVNAFRSGTNIYGAAAMKSAQRLIGSNIITGAASVVILSTFDIVNIFRGRISGAQLFKNMVNTGASVAGGTAGWSAGATAGAYVGSFIPLPGIGTAAGAVVGGLLGAFAGGSTAGKVANAITDEFIEDDDNEMINIIEEQFRILAVDYLLNKNEVENVVDTLAQNLDGSTLKDMYALSNREEFAGNILIRNIELTVKRREVIKTPSEKTMVNGLKSVLEEMA